MCIRCELLLSELVKRLSVLSARVRPTGETVDHYRDADVDRAQNGANLRRVSQVSEWDKRACVEGSWGGSARWPAVVSRETPQCEVRSLRRKGATMRAERGRRLVNRIKSRRQWQPSVRTGTTPSCTHTTMTKRDDKSLAEQNAEIRRWAEENGFTVGSRLGEKRDAVELAASRVPVVEVTVHIDEDVYEAAMLRATYDGYDNASEVVEAALREWARGY